MSETKCLIDLILAGNEELMKQSRAPFVKKTVKRALASARDSVSITMADAQLKVQDLYQDITRLPDNLSRICELQDTIEKAKTRKAQISQVYTELFGKVMPEEEMD